MYFYSFSECSAGAPSKSHGGSSLEATAQLLPPELQLATGALQPCNPCSLQFLPDGQMIAQRTLNTCVPSTKNIVYRIRSVETNEERCFNALHVYNVSTRGTCQTAKQTTWTTSLSSSLSPPSTLIIVIITRIINSIIINILIILNADILTVITIFSATSTISRDGDDNDDDTMMLTITMPTMTMWQSRWWRWWWHWCRRG